MRKEKICFKKENYFSVLKKELDYGISCAGFNSTGFPLNLLANLFPNKKDFRLWIFEVPCGVAFLAFLILPLKKPGI